jgi:hypothetical protein
MHNSYQTLYVDRTDGCSLVCLCVVLVVLDPPGLEGVDEGHEGQGAHNVLKQLVGAEAAVTTVVANHKELSHGKSSSGALQIQVSMQW